MPYKFEQEGFKIGMQNDRRRKLTNEQYIEIRLKYGTGLTSQRLLAKEYGVSRRLITFILDPLRLARQVERHNSKDYYDREKHLQYMKKHRAYKKQLYKKNKEE